MVWKQLALALLNPEKLSSAAIGIAPLVIVFDYPGCLDHISNYSTGVDQLMEIIAVPPIKWFQFPSTQREKE